MKLIFSKIFASLFFFCAFSTNTLADCDVLAVDPDSKLQAALAILDAVLVVNNDEKMVEAAFKQPKDAAARLVALKQESSDFSCERKKLNKFFVTNKNRIKNQISMMTSYLDQKITWNSDAEKCLDAENFSSEKILEEAVATLHKRRNVDLLVFQKASISLNIVIFEQSDAPEVDKEKLDEDLKRNFKIPLGITSAEANTLGEKVAEVSKTAYLIETAQGSVAADTMYADAYEYLNFLRAHYSRK